VRPVRPLEALWEAWSRTQGSSPAPPSPPPPTTTSFLANAAAQEEVRSLAEMRAVMLERGADGACKKRSVHRALLEGPATAATKARVREELLRTDEHGVIQQTWSDVGATELRLDQWEPCPDGGVSLAMRLVLPLKPRPLSPKQTRMVLVYHLSAEGEAQVVLTEFSRSLDVPYTNSFEVHSQHAVSLADDVLTLDNLVGVRWRGRCMVKGMIESASQQEAFEAAQRWTESINKAVARPVQPAR